MVPHAQIVFSRFELVASLGMFTSGSTRSQPDLAVSFLAKGDHPTTWFVLDSRSVRFSRRHSRNVSRRVKPREDLARLCVGQRSVFGLVFVYNNCAEELSV